METARPLTRRFLLGTGLCLCCAPTLARAASVAGPATLREVAPGIHIRTGVTADATAQNQDAIANIGFVVGHHSVAVMDPGGSLADGTALREALRRVTPLPVRYVILSHVHPDHVFGAAAFAPDHPRFVGHANLPAALAARGAFYQRELTALLGPDRAGPVVTPDLLVHDHLTLDLGGRSLMLTAHPPAHTDADLSALDSATHTLLTADLLFVNRVPALDGDLKGWLAQLDALAAMNPRAAVPGHGPPRVDYSAAAAPLRRYLDILLRETRAAVRNSVPIEQAAHTVAQSERSHWALFDDYNARNVLEAYRQLEWE
jgi:quinoprotein relay system zinc metallohydrolase 2